MVHTKVRRHPAIPGNGAVLLGIGLGTGGRWMSGAHSSNRVH